MVKVGIIVGQWLNGFSRCTERTTEARRLHIGDDKLLQLLTL